MEFEGREFSRCLALSFRENVNSLEGILCQMLEIESGAQVIELVQVLIWVLIRFPI